MGHSLKQGTRTCEKEPKNQDLKNQEPKNQDLKPRRRDLTKKNTEKLAPPMSLTLLISCVIQIHCSHNL